MSSEPKCKECKYFIPVYEFYDTVKNITIKWENECRCVKDFDTDLGVLINKSDIDTHPYWCPLAKKGVILCSKD